jgi:hypothetical protein
MYSGSRLELFLVHHEGRRDNYPGQFSIRSILYCDAEINGDRKLAFAIRLLFY